MKIKTKKSGKMIVLSVLFGLCMCCGIFFGGFGTTTAHAATATTPKYTLQLDYSIKTTAGSTSASVSYTTGTAYSATMYKSSSGTEEVTVSIYGSSSSGTGNLAKGGYINSSTVNIAINSSVATGTITVKNSSGTQVGSGGKSLTLTGLADGLYSVDFYFGGAAWATSSRSGMSKYTSASSSFYVDSTTPTISGASTSTTGKYTNAAFTVSASDSGGSGLAALYYKTPDSSSYSTVASSRTFAAGSVNGLYYFYARDNAGNQSSTYYVYYDNVKPTGVVKNSSGTTLTSAYTKEAFYYTASDSGSGVSYLQYIPAGSSSWTSYTSGTTIAATATNGQYQFRTVDKAGNISDTTTITLDTVNPTGVLYSGTTAVSSGNKSTASYIKYVASDATSGVKAVYVKKPNASAYTTYTSGTQLTENGDYSFYCVDNVGLQSPTVTISLDNTKPTVTLTGGTWGNTIANGFSVSASDNIGGTVLYYKVPSSQYFVQSTTTSISIPKTYEDGTYQFYATDGFGNTSATYNVTLYIAPPVAQIVRASNGTQVCVIWTDSSASGKLNGESYVNGTWIKTEGDHTFILTNDANRSTTYTFSIDHYYVKTTTVVPTCTADGYSIYKCDNCGDAYNADYVDALGHNYIVTKTVESTCTAEGYSVYTCSRCGATFNDDVVSANGHDYGSWYTIKDSTCTETGTKRRDCISCGAYETDVISPKGHNYIPTVTAPTCTEQGYTTHVCSRCDETYVDSYVEPKGHTYVATVTEPTCTDRGYTTQTCKYCGDYYIENYVNAHGHEYGAWRIVTSPTCLENGLRYKTCSTCSNKYSEVISALGHNYGSEIVEPTCVDKGYTTHICSRCGTGYNDTFVDALGHDYKAKRVEPTCTEEGYIGQCCSRCSDTYKTEILRARGHEYVETYVAVTCTEEGCILHICLECGYEYKTDIVRPSGHSLETHVLLASTCENKGERYYGCTKCDYERIDEIPEQGHNYEIAETETVDGVITRRYICSKCTDEYTQEMGEQYEKVSNYVEYLFDEYSPYMMWVFLATAGVWSIAMGIAIIIATKNEDKAKAKKMLVNYGIGLIVIFAILVAAPYLVKGIAALVT